MDNTINSPESSNRGSRSPLSVLFLVHNVAWKGGAFFHGLGLARGLVERGHDVTIMSISPDRRVGFTETIEDGLKLVESPDLLSGVGRTGWDPWDTICRIFYVRKRRFDVLHCVDTRPAVVLPALAGRSRNGGIFVPDWTDWWGRGGAITERTGWLIKALFGPLETFFEEHFRPAADGTVVISQALFERAKGLGIDESTIVRLPAGCDTDRIVPMEKQQARTQLGVPANKIRLGYLGNIYQNDLDLLITAVERVRKNGIDCELLMAGIFKAEVPQHVVDDGWLVRTGYVSFDDMITHLCACDVLLLPLTDSVANRGRWPSKINDYLAVGRPIVSNAVGDLTILFEQADIGYLSAPDPEDFAYKIEKLLGEPETHEARGNNARALAENEYSWSAIVRELEDFYYATINRAESEKANR